MIRQRNDITSAVAPARRFAWHRFGWLLIAFLLAAYWLLPIRGQVIISTDGQQDWAGAWPQMRLDPIAIRPDQPLMLYVRDNAPWPHVRLEINGVAAERDAQFDPGDGPVWTWRWRLSEAPAANAQAVFFHDCHNGCVERGRATLGATPLATPLPRVPTRLGAVFADAERDWHNRAAWTVELTYVQREDDDGFGINGLAQRVQQAADRDLNILVRVAYDRGQSLPPIGDDVALQTYLDELARMARDDRLRAVDGYIIGSGYNWLGENTQRPDKPTTPQWYARVFNGYGLPAARTDNAIQTIHAYHPDVAVLVGPVTPWIADQNGTFRDPLDVPWLNYFNTVVDAIGKGAAAKTRSGIDGTTPDGFALQAPGRPAAPEVASNPAREPLTDLHRPEWGEAQAGFRIYRDWLRIINRSPHTRGLPVYISSTNTWTSDTQVPPAQNYPAGWLPNALAEVNREPQIKALCWFVDVPLGEVWTEFSLNRHPGRLNAAAADFDRLLQQGR